MPEIVVAISGGIAAYKSAELVRALVQRGHAVTVAMTAGAREFVAPLTFAALSGRPVLTDVWRMSDQGTIVHVDTGKRAALIVVAPATADLIARLHAGQANDAPTALVLSSICPVLIAPAMESDMWNAAATRRNVGWLAAQTRFHFIGPDSGALASGHSGPGRMSEPQAIAAAAEALLTPGDLTGCHLVITAGPTREPLDPVRFLTNRSSGKMGFVLAERAAQRGAQVTLIAGPVSLPTPAAVTRINIETAADMLAALQIAVPQAHALLMAAAVCDYAPQTRAATKLKKDKLGHAPTLSLVETPDLLKTLRPLKGQTVFVGFAAETNDVASNAQRKLAAKGLDLIVANDVSQPGIGFDSDDNAATIFDATHLVRDIPRTSKRALADAILDELRVRLPAALPLDPLA